MTNQRIALRRQGISRVEWERLPWTGHVCYLFTRAWECCRYRSKLMRDGRYDACATFLEKCREPCTDWLRGEHPPRDFENRGTIDQDQWSENWKVYSTNLEVFDFYQCHLDKFIRKNDKLWIDFCKTFEDPVTNRCILNSTQGQVI